MSRQSHNRSLTLVRQADALFPGKGSNIDSLPPINNPRRSSNSLEISPIRAVEPKALEEQLQAEGQRNNYSEANRRSGNQAIDYYFAPEQAVNANENKSQMLLKRFDHKSNFYNGWDQVVNGKAESEKRAVLEQKIEERLRKQRYK